MREFSNVSIICYLNGYNIVDTIEKSSFYSLGNIDVNGILVHNRAKNVLICCIFIQKTKQKFEIFLQSDRMKT